MKEDRPSTSSKEKDTHKPTSLDLRSVNMSSSQAMALGTNITQALEDRVISSTWLDNTTDYLLTNQRDKFKEELDEQQAIVQSLDNNTTDISSKNIMNDSMNSFADDFMNEVNEQRSTTTVSSTSTTMRATSNDMTSTTRQESLFNQRKRVRLVNTVTRPFNPISTLNVHLPNDVDTISYRPLSPERLVEFDQFCRRFDQLLYLLVQMQMNFQQLLDHL